MNTNASPRQLALILAALRYTQYHADFDLADTLPYTEYFVDCPQPVTDDEIDALCEQLVSCGHVKIPVASILLRRVEGPFVGLRTVFITPRAIVHLQDDDAAHYCPVRDNPVPSVWEIARSTLCRWRRSAPEIGNGYHKVDFTVTWANGHQYEGRYDIHRDSSGDIAEQILTHLGIVAGTRQPHWLSDEQWQQCLADRSYTQNRPMAREALKTYDLGANSSNASGS